MLRVCGKLRVGDVQHAGIAVEELSHALGADEVPTQAKRQRDGMDFLGSLWWVRPGSCWSNPAAAV